MIVPVIPLSSDGPVALETAPSETAIESRRFSIRQIAFVISFLLVLGLTVYFGARSTRAHPSPRVMLAIMPFENFDPESRPTSATV
jgi:hypothetical protein